VNIKTKKIDDANILISGAIAQEDIDAKVDALAVQTGKQIKVDGFRKGKVPAHAVKKLYGEKLAEDAEGEALRDMLNEAYKEAGISAADILGDPMFKKYDKNDKEIDVEIQLCLRPTVDTKDYKKIIPEFKEPEVTAKEINERIDTLSAQAAPLESIKTKRALKKGDTAVFDFEGFVDGEPFEGGKAENYELEIGSNQFIPGFEDGMSGMKTGEEKTIKVKFPDDYQAENLKSKDAEFVVKLHDIKVRGEVKLDDELAKKITNDQNATVETLKEGIKEQLKGEKISKVYNDEVKPQLIEALVKHFDFALPENIVEQEIDNLVNQKAQSMSREEIQEIQGNADKLEKLRDEVREDATSSVKATFIVDALAKEEQLSVKDDEVSQVLYYEAVMSGQNPDEVIKYYTKNNLLPAVKMSMLEDKLYYRLLGLDKL
jgi:trigger factor